MFVALGDKVAWGAGTCNFEDEQECGNPGEYHIMWDFHGNVSTSCHRHYHEVVRRHLYVYKHEMSQECLNKKSIFEEDGCRVIGNRS